MNNKELKSLVQLLDDDDVEVVGHVEEKLKTLGTGVIPFLEEAWEQTFNPKAHERIEDLVHFLQFELAQERLTHWYEHEKEDLLKGMWILATYQYPDLEYTQLSNKIEHLYREIWTQMGPDLLPFDQIKTINSMLFEKYKFRANTKNFHAPGNSMINSLLESSKGNPISLSALYLLITQKLGLPIFGVNLPNLFVLTYKTDKLQFYINVFNRGLIFSKEDIDNYIAQLQLMPQNEYFEPCDHGQIIKRSLRNLMVAFDKIGDYHKSDEIKKLMSLITGS